MLFLNNLVALVLERCNEESETSPFLLKMPLRDISLCLPTPTSTRFRTITVLVTLSSSFFVVGSPVHWIATPNYLNLTD